MEMKRRSLVLGVPLGVAALSGCGSKANREAQSPYREIQVSEAVDSEAATIVVFMPDTPQSQEVWRGLNDEAGGEFRLVAVQVDGRSSVHALREAMVRHEPKALVLMNNTTLAAYREYQQRYAQEEFPPAFAVMTSFLSQESSLSRTTGVSYEVPLITVVTNLRKVLRTPIHRIGIVTRPELTGFVEAQVALARKEKITVAVEGVSAQPNPAEIKRALRRVKREVDALWVLNDNHLLTPRLIREGWVPGMNERPWLPVIVGAAPFVSPGANFGTFALVPDHPSLGAQVANMIFDLADSEWQADEDVPVQVPVSTVSTIDLNQARERLALRDDALQKIDRVLRR